MFQFVRFPSHTQWYGWLCITTAGLLHSDICGSKIICISPQLFAACHVLLRQISPRHPPYALSILTYVFTLTFLAFWVSFSTSEKSFLDELFFFRFFFYIVFKEQVTWLLSGWWRWGESNSWPPACKAGALPAELRPHTSCCCLLKYFLVGLSGLEPLTSRLSGVRSNQLSYRPVF